MYLRRNGYANWTAPAKSRSTTPNRYPFYYRAALAFYIKGDISEEELYARSASWAKDKKVRVLNEAVIKVDTNAGEVTGDSGMVLPYDRLLVASGAEPFVAPWPGVDLEGVMTYRTLMCASKTIDYVKRHNVKKATVIGGGILGVEYVEDLVSLGVEVTIIALEDRLLELLFDSEASAVIMAQMAAEGINIKLKAQTARIAGAGSAVSGVELDSGEMIDAQLCRRGYRR